MRLFYIANARLPSEKAHGIQIAKMCEAFLAEGVNLTLVVPARKNATGKSVQEFYGLKREIPMIPLPVFDWYEKGRAGYALSTLSFMCSYATYLLFHAKRGDVAYTVDLDHLAYAALALLRIPFFSEMHGGKPGTLLHQVLFARVRGVIATNPITKKQLQEKFYISPEQLLVLPNGVDFSVFKSIEKDTARAELGLPKEQSLALYVGRFFDWKGLEILVHAAPFLPGNVTLGIVGGTVEEFRKVTGENHEKIVFYGEKPYTQIPLWASSADALLVLGTRRDEQSYRYTSPMKVFEYMAMKRPIVASRTPALESILGPSECLFYEPDDAPSLAARIAEAVLPSPENSARVERAYSRATGFSWEMRAKRAIAFMEALLSKKTV